MEKNNKEKNKIDALLEDDLGNVVLVDELSATEKKINNISIKFQNQGNTIPKEKLERIFEQFYRLDTARSTRSGGAGLGLAIAKEIVELHGGSIKAVSEDEVIEFEVVLPLL